MVDEMAQHLWCRGLFHRIQHGLVPIERLVGMDRRRGLDLGGLEVEGMEPHNHQRTAHRGIWPGRYQEPVHWVASKALYFQHYYW